MSRQILDLDVREILKNKGEPFQLIMETVQKVGPSDVLQLQATFEPTPLMRLLGKQGFEHAVQKEADDHYIVQFYRDGGDVPYWHLDNRGLEPPQPMIRTLQWLDQIEGIKVGAYGLEIWNERVPAFLLPELEDRNLQYEYRDEGEATVVVRIHA